MHSTAADFTFTDLDAAELIYDANSRHRDIQVQLTSLADYPLQSGPGAVTVASPYRDAAQRVRDFRVYDDDVWIVTFPKSGTTWTEEMAWLLGHELDYGTAATISLSQRSTFLEYENRIGAIQSDRTVDTIAIAANSQRPRQIKSHLPVSLLPRELWTVKPKIIYVARNPKDVAVSYYHHFQGLVGYRGTKEAFFDAMLRDQITYCPMVRHVVDFWSLKDEPNVLFLTYESMKRDLRALLPQVCEFLGKTYTESQLDHLATHLSFDEMKKNKATNKQEVVRSALQQYNSEGVQFEFFRKGIVGDFRNEMSEDYIARFDELIANQSAGSNFQYEQQ